MAENASRKGHRETLKSVDQTVPPEFEPGICDVALVGGRVVDPETGLDEIRNVGITGSTISTVSSAPIPARKTLDVSGLVVAPGWIDLHSHAQSIAGGRLQARDGVTTALELEAGASPVAEAYAHAAVHGRPINYGYSTSWQQARMVEVGGLQASGELTHALMHFGDPAWQRPASAKQRAAMFDRLREDLDNGALGIGVMIGYAPRVDPGEYVGISRIAAEAGVTTFTHPRALSEQVPDTPIDGAEEIVRVTQETGVRAHYCHIHSTALRQIDRVHRLIEASPSPVTTEAYPYGAGMTAISADFLAPERLHELGITPQSIVYAPTGESVSDALHLKELRKRDPGGLALIHYLHEEDPMDQALLDTGMTFPGTIVASDAIPFTWHTLGKNPMDWPPPLELVTHPRTAGTFSKYIRRYVRELSALSLLEAVGRCTLAPAQVLEPFVPAMTRKGRVQPGCDADLVVFDLQRISDQSTFQVSTRASTGYSYVLVNGQILVRDDELITDVLPGRPVRAGGRLS
ncbi:MULTISPECIES: amidohydrolase family protein [unclassified Arthrobacter]|uniref:amidohydrolase family protein n=1 Tax=unclassified Arthrobacter TaxID=235627 RepID=UPI001C6169DB|nr:MULTISPECIES: amidohydrolase family protein [unclassified Arthrobacter]